MAEEMGQAQGRVILHQGEKTENLYKRHSVCLLTCKKGPRREEGGRKRGQADATRSTQLRNHEFGLFSFLKMVILD